MSKKGALELSINAIVIIVLAMTLLGLGITFIKSQMGKIMDTSTAVSDMMRDKILEDLRAGDKSLSFPTPEIKISRGKAQVIAIGVKNINDKPLTFKIRIFDKSVDEEGNPRDCPPGAASSEYFPSTRASGECSAFFWDNTEQVLQAGQDKVIGIKLFPPGQFNSYLYKLEVTNEDTGDEYASKTFFVQVV